MAKYYSIMTNVGLAATANAAVLGKKVNLTTFAVGDGSGAFYSPVPTMTALKGQKWSGSISGYNVSAESPNLISVTGLIPSDVGGWTIREIGVFDDQGRLIAIANYPDTEKISRDDGVSTEIHVGIELLLSNASSVTISVDPTMILATKAEVNAVQDNLNDFKEKALTGGKLGSTSLTVTGNALVIPAADSIHDGYMTKAQAGQLAQAVPNTRKLNGHALTGDVTLTASDVGARPATWVPTYNDIGAPSLSSYNSLVSQMTNTQASVAQLQTNLNGSWKTLVTDTKPSSLSSNTIYYIVNDSGCLAQLARFGSKDISLMPFGVSDIDYLAVCVVYKKCDAMKMGSSYTVESTYVASDIQDFTGTSYSGIGGSSLSLTSSKVSGTIQGNVYDAKKFFIGFTFELVTNSGVHIPIEQDRYNWNGWMDSLYKLVNGITSLKISGVFTREYYVWITAHMLSNTISFPNNSNSVTENFEISSIPTGASLSSYYEVCPSVSNSSSVTVGINFSCSINGRSITCKVEDYISH